MALPDRVSADFFVGLLIFHGVARAHRVVATRRCGSVRVRHVRKGERKPSPAAASHARYFNVDR